MLTIDVDASLWRRPFGPTHVYEPLTFSRLAEKINDKMRRGSEAA
jgi:hypothetical protein